MQSLKIIWSKIVGGTGFMGLVIIFWAHCIVLCKHNCQKEAPLI
ncbi:MAG: hypothetical protein ACXQTY_06585 [Candidatus Methanogasteraceae archaeon]